MDKVHQEQMRKMIIEKDSERIQLKKSLEIKINILEDQLINADHRNTTLIKEKVQMRVFKK